MAGEREEREPPCRSPAGIRWQELFLLLLWLCAGSTFFFSVWRGSLRELYHVRLIAIHRWEEEASVVKHRGCLWWLWGWLLWWFLFTFSFSFLYWEWQLWHVYLDHWIWKWSSTTISFLMLCFVMALDFQTSQALILVIITESNTPKPRVSCELKNPT